MSIWFYYINYYENEWVVSQESNLLALVKARPLQTQYGAAQPAVARCNCVWVKCSSKQFENSMIRICRHLVMVRLWRAAVWTRATIVCPIRCLCLLARKDVRRRTIRRGGEVLVEVVDVNEQVVAFDLASFVATRASTRGDQALDEFGCHLLHYLLVAA